MAGIAGTETSQKPRSKPLRRPTAISFAIHPRHVRTLLWLRWKLTLRGYTRNTGRVVGLVFMLIFLVPVLGGLAFASLAAYESLPADSAAALLFLVMSGLYLIWAVLPLLFYTLNEGLDVTKLQIYPLTRGEQMVALVLATLLDISTLFILFFYAAILLAWHNTPVALAITAVALIAAYIHTVSLSQLTLAVLMGLLRTRRYRDITILVFALFGVACSFSGEVLGHLISAISATNGAPPPALHSVELYLRWTPPGMAAQAIVLAGNGQYATALAWLSASLLLVPIVLVLWAWVLDRGITTAESAGGGAARRRRQVVNSTSVATGAAVAPARTAEPARSATSRRGWTPVSSAARAIAWKDARYLWRDPQLKAQLLSTLFLIVLILFPNIFSGGSAAQPSNFGVPSLLAGDASVLLAIVPALLVTQTLTQNSLGMDRQGLQTLFLFPVRSLDILFGKNLFAGSFAMVFIAVLSIAKAALTGGWSFIPLTLCGGLAAVLLVMACGNVTSVLLPIRWRQMRMGDTSSLAGENGCLRGVLQMVVLVVVAILLIPIAVALLLPVLADHNEWFLISVPLALLFSIGLYQGATRLIAPVLRRRAPEILGVTVREA